jgi:hypothetical protein
VATLAHGAGQACIKIVAILTAVIAHPAAEDVGARFIVQGITVHVGHSGKVKELPFYISTTTSSSEPPLPELSPLG